MCSRSDLVMAHAAINLYRLNDRQITDLQGLWAYYYDVKKIIRGVSENDCDIWQVEKLTEEQKAKRKANIKKKREEEEEEEEAEQKKEEGKKKRERYPQKIVPEIDCKLGVHVISYFLGNLRVAPPLNVISHLCHEPTCVNISHLNLEPQSINNKRKACRSTRVCKGHTGQPNCIFPPQAKGRSARS